MKIPNFRSFVSKELSIFFPVDILIWHIMKYVANALEWLICMEPFSSVKHILKGYNNMFKQIIGLKRELMFLIKKRKKENPKDK